MRSLLLSKVSTLLALCLLTFSVEAVAQQRVSGKITDKATGEPLVGVSVAVKGTSKGVITNVDGKYTIEVAPDATLLLGYLGYKDLSIDVDGRSVVNATMESDINTLDEVVMVGYSSMKKAELSSAVTTMQGDKLRDVTTPDLGSMLQGKIAGVQVTNSSGAPGSSATIRIRGTGSIAAGSDPLYVVDGVAGGTFNPNDVESITVLKVNVFLRAHC